MNTLKRLLAEVVNLFPDNYIHIGSDETFSNNQKCTFESLLNCRVHHSDCRLTYTGTKSLETEVAKYILSLGRTPVAWEEALFNSDVVCKLCCNVSLQLICYCFIGGSRNCISNMVNL